MPVQKQFASGLEAIHHVAQAEECGAEAAADRLREMLADGSLDAIPAGEDRRRPIPRGDWRTAAFLDNGTVLFNWDGRTQSPADPRHSGYRPSCAIEISWKSLHRLWPEAVDRIVRTGPKPGATPRADSMAREALKAEALNQFPKRGWKTAVAREIASKFPNYQRDTISSNIRQTLKEWEKKQAPREEP